MLQGSYIPSTAFSLMLTFGACQIDNDVHKAIYESSIEDYDKVLSINAKGVMTCTRAVSKVMLAQEARSVRTRNGVRDVGRGSIINIGSANSYAALPGKVAYVASKHAMMGITKTAGGSATHVLCSLLMTTG